MLQLNLGAGTSRYQDHVSIDFHTDADVIHDLTTPLPYSDGEVDALYASHVVEHFTRAEWDDICQDWSRVLKPAGKLELRCPDIRKLCELYLADPSPLRLMQIYGLQSHPGEFHKNGFTKETLMASFPGMTAELLEPSTDYELHMRFTK